MDKIVEWKVEDLGIEHSSYFQGAGTAYTKWDMVFVGIGDDYFEALDDALEQAAMSLSLEDSDNILETIEKEEHASITEQQVSDASVSTYQDELVAEGEIDEDDLGESELFYHVAVYVKLSDDSEHK